MAEKSIVDPLAPTGPPMEGGAHEPALSPGTVVGGSYQVESLIGRGGMGTVYRATHRELHRPFAVKVVRTKDAHDPRAAMRLVQEARTASGIRHDHIVDVTDLGHTDGIVYVVMELLEGEDLSERIEREGGEPLPDEEVERVVDEILSGIAAAHRKGVIHRDLKPANIFLAQRDERTVVKILDFGMSKLLGTDGSVQLTHSGQLVGTPLYMSPEQSRGAELDHRADIYSLGVIMYELLAGEVPFPGSSIYELVLMHTTESPSPLEKRRPDLPADVVDLVHRCLEKDPHDRFASALELRQAWRSAWGQPSLEMSALTSGEAEVVPVASRRPWLWGVAVVALLAAVVAGFAISSPDDAVMAVGATPPSQSVPSPPVRHVAPSSASSEASDPEAPPLVDAPRSSTAAPVHTVRLTSSPSGASVFRGGERVGTTPHPVTVAEGEGPATYTLRMDGYRAATATVDETSPATVETELRPRAPRRPREPVPDLGESIYE